jgi:anti-sigma factor ChrR (cupin superfamily)
MRENSNSGLLHGGWKTLDFEPFREGVRVHHLVMAGDDTPGVALLAYAPGASVPRHRHPGLETIVVLEGVQSDEAGDYPAGTVVFNHPGSEHSVWSDGGCVVLIQWDKPVEFL